MALLLLKGVLLNIGGGCMAVKCVAVVIRSVILHGVRRAHPTSACKGACALYKLRITWHCLTSLPGLQLH